MRRLCGGWLKYRSRLRFHSITSERINDQIITAQQSAKEIYKFTRRWMLTWHVWKLFSPAYFNRKKKTQLQAKKWWECRKEITLNFLSFFFSPLFVIVIKILFVKNCYVRWRKHGEQWGEKKQFANKNFGTRFGWEIIWKIVNEKFVARGWEKEEIVFERLRGDKVS